jgi:hypothetical protein
VKIPAVDLPTPDQHHRIIHPITIASPRDATADLVAREVVVDLAVNHH